jgi:uncharacterized protein YidB (DUF937 family)
MDAAANLLGMSASDLRTAMQSGQSLSQIASSKGVGQDQLIAAMSTAIQQANPGMSADRATSVATAIATRTPQVGTAGASGATDQAAASAFGATQAAGTGATHGQHYHHHAMAAGMQAAAQTLGVSTDELTSSLKSGQSLTSLASSKGVSQDDLITAISTALQQSDTSLSSDQASQIATRIATSTPESQSWATPGGGTTSTFGVTA